jgi:tellurite resistance protein TerC
VLVALHEKTLPFLDGGRPIEAVPPIPTWLSLTVIVGVLGTATVASLVTTRREARKAEPIGAG